jgi:hypothetical protein
MTEDEYKARLAELLGQEFELEPEAEGWWPTGESVCLDFLCRPKAQARSQGFPVEAFGIEVKSPDTGNEAVKKLLDAVLQSYTYTLSTFSQIRPSFVLIYPGVRRFFQARYPNTYRDEDWPVQDKDVDILRRLMQRANVGEIVEDPRVGYEFRFGRCRLYDPTRGTSNVKNLGSVRRVGSRKL